MVNFLLQHPDSMVFASVFTAMFGYALRKNRIYSTKVQYLTRRIQLIIANANLGSMDIMFTTDQEVAHGKTNTLTLIEDDHNKGYDFIHMRQDAGVVMPPHKHRRTNELFYIISGKIEFSVCNKGTPPEDCIALAVNTSILEAGDHFFVKSGFEHSFIVIEPAEYLVIAKPPLFSRIGKIYELLFKKEKYA